MDNDLVTSGFAIVPDVLNEVAVAELREAVAIEEASTDGASAGRIYAMRNLFRVPAVQAAAASPAIRALVEPHLGRECFAVRALFFDKLPEANWKVPWHQDVSIAVVRQAVSEEFGPWSVKAGVPHVQAPAPLLERMLTVRLHLDTCGAENGPLRAVVGSHRHGKLTAAQIEALREQSREVVCLVDSGGALLMRPLLLHASSPSQAPGHRRVVHIEFANFTLPDGLEWHDMVRGAAA
jgi:ectoine hydroxylase-related dioxygenase (phytanoyl-CoA dioxygenase family)